MAPRSKPHQWIAALILLCFFTSAGGAAFTMQVYAWGKMFLRFSQTQTLIQAAQDTLDGEHPCEMCHRVEESTAQSRGEWRAFAPPVLVLGLPEREALVSVFFRTLARSVDSAPRFFSVILSPPSPPPQLLS